MVFLLQKNNCCEALLPVLVPGWRFYYVQKRKGVDIDVITSKAVLLFGHNNRMFFTNFIIYLYVPE